jgi:hypothetical protein
VGGKLGEIGNIHVMKPTSARAARRIASKTGAAKTPDFDAIAQRVQQARIKGVGKPLMERAQRIMMSYLQTTQSHGVPSKTVLAQMASGEVAWQLAHAVRGEIMKNPPPEVQNAACAQGCAFCCILTHDEGGIITAYEAQNLADALIPLPGAPDGRAWHDKACPALDPETRSCRAYDARPMICRSFLSTDVETCRANAAGETETGAGLLGSHLDYLMLHALCRQALKGISQVRTYGMRQVAAAIIDGKTTEQALPAARHSSAILDDACSDAAIAAKS